MFHRNHTQTAFNGFVIVLLNQNRHTHTRVWFQSVLSKWWMDDRLNDAEKDFDLGTGTFYWCHDLIIKGLMTTLLWAECKQTNVRRFIVFMLLYSMISTAYFFRVYACILFGCENTKSVFTYWADGHYICIIIDVRLFEHKNQMRRVIFCVLRAFCLYFLSLFLSLLYTLNRVHLHFIRSITQNKPLNNKLLNATKQ